ncbi:GNAT family N-acetyltransferase [Desulfosporosinus burensis]
MLFETDKTYISVVAADDIDSIVEIYNSNPGFLMAHLDRERINAKWVEDEMNTMKEIGFMSSKVMLKNSNTSIGVLDFLVNEESYLSLLMLHSDNQYLGLGSEVYKGFEHFAKVHKSKRIRIDVVTSYDKNVLNFWISKGFNIIEQVKLKWSGKNLPAVKMKKNIS